MPPKPKPQGKNPQPPPGDNRKCQVSNADEQPINWPHRGTNQRDAKPDTANEEEDGEDSDEEGEEDPAPWAEVEDSEQAISKGKVKGPAQGRGGSRGQGGNWGQGVAVRGKKPRYLHNFIFFLPNSLNFVGKLPRPIIERMQLCKPHQQMNKQCNFY